ncbi:hypothetical protein SLA_0025 [Streptomyces laurentii]|uniref:Uncharacterized protein n=1 Tax=Streptomyces laurentii TaxID=39478 RepID=A0A160NU06_STRLU|nr:hypothetical protein SLA_0025 [Streptomyces laurentii]
MVVTPWGVRSGGLFACRGLLSAPVRWVLRADGRGGRTGAVGRRPGAVGRRPGGQETRLRVQALLLKPPLGKATQPLL